MNDGPDHGKAGGDGPVQDHDRVIRLDRHAPADAPFDAARIVAGLRGFWDGLRAGRAVPDRTDVTPAAMGPAVDYAFILERTAPGAARLRLAGRHLVDLMGMEVRGMPLSALFNPPSRGQLSDVLEAVFRGPQIADLVLRSPAGFGRGELEARMMLLPLKSDLGDVSRALGCLVSGSPCGAAPRRFDMIRDVHLPVIEGARPLRPGPGGFADGAPDWRPPPPPPPPRGGGPKPGGRPAGAKPPATPDERRAAFRVIPGKGGDPS
ncbi:MAG: PAS domain-containing protein [Paracoccus sp. (in: a-proteobacteria)]|nr:PAS domain-containing protein [Paracoccus sp. (in: a-proteobacteria)]